MKCESLNNRWDFRKDKNDVLELTRINVRRHGIPYGNTIAIKKEVFLKSIPFPKGYGHDEWLSLCAPLFGEVITSEEKLIKYRRHFTNTSGNTIPIKERLMNWDKEAWFTHAFNIKIVYCTYLQRYDDLIPIEIKKELYMQIEFQQLLEDITTGKCRAGFKLLRMFFNGTYQKLRGTRNTFFLDELYLILHARD